MFGTAKVGDFGWSWVAMAECVEDRKIRNKQQSEVERANYTTANQQLARRDIAR